MFGVTSARSVFVAAVVAVVMAPVAAGAATAAPPTTAPPPGSSTPTTTIPGGLPTPPTPFILPSNYGYQQMQELQQGKAELKVARGGVGRARRRLREAKINDARIQKQLLVLRKQQKQTEEQLETTRGLLRDAAVQAYIHAGSGDLMAAVSTVLNANSAVEVASQLHVIESYGNSMRATLDEYLALKQQIADELTTMTGLAQRSAQELHDARYNADHIQAQLADAKKKIADATQGIAVFHLFATSALSPILGPSQLTAQQMADYIVANGYKTNITVPILDLAQIYLDEGAKTGVRGDVAFAQSILETGGFANPGSAATDNNFAGIGWCDTCPHGFNFLDARTGVRAQLQLLRIYVDPTFPGKTYKDKILLPGTLKLGFRGQVQTWWDLWGTWATGALYGQRVYDIYEKMVAFAKVDPLAPATTTTTTPPKHP